MRAGHVRAMLLAAGIVVMAACGTKLPPTPSPSSPHFPDFAFPAVPAPLAADRTTAGRHERGWAFLQANDLRSASREFEAALTRNVGFYPAEAGLGYVLLAQKDYGAALGRFDSALHGVPMYAPALVGRGDALLGLGRSAEALMAFENALAADPSLSIARERVQVLVLRVLQEQLANARSAADAGRYDEARQAYERAIAASPESAFLYRDLGAVERRQGDRKSALESFRHAVSLDATDAKSYVPIGEMLEEDGNLDGALQAYTKAAALEPGDTLAARIERTRARAALAKMPPEYAAIPQTPRLTRADLAALVGVRFAPLLDMQQPRDQALVTDVRGNWAATWILAVSMARVMDVLPNHTFRPRANVSRADLAYTVSRLLDLADAARPSMSARWRGAKPRIADVPATHLSYPAVTAVVASGVMPLFEDGTFRPRQIVTGEEAIAALDRLEKLTGRNATTGGGSGERRP